MNEDKLIDEYNRLMAFDDKCDSQYVSGRYFLCFVNSLVFIAWAAIYYFKLESLNYPRVRLVTPYVAVILVFVGMGVVW